MSVASALQPRSADTAIDLVRAFDAKLALPEIEGMPIGSTLTDSLVIEFINGGGRWGIFQRWLDRLRWLRAYYLARHATEWCKPPKTGQILVTWRSSTARINDLVLPVLEALSPDRCMVIYQNPNVLRHLPLGMDSVHSLRAALPDRDRWVLAFRRCWSQWRSHVQSLAAEFALPYGTVERLDLEILLNSQLAVGCLAMLERYRPTAIVTDYDRARLPSCLVLAARCLGIPTFSLQHGVLGQDAVGYVPVLANRMFCWGEFHRRKMIKAGQDPARMTIGGCPRLVRDLPADPQNVRKRLGIDPSHRVVMLGTSPVPAGERRTLAEWFCGAASQLDGVAALVRLHPSEKLDFYADVAREYQTVTFFDNLQLSLEEALAVCDIVVVQSSGLGSDALVKRRLTIVVAIPDAPLGHGKDLIEEAGCPKATSVAELAAALQSLLTDEEARRRQFAQAERYVKNFCAAYGADSARRIAEQILEPTSVERNIHRSLPA
jgi:hypothetical protein